MRPALVALGGLLLIAPTLAACGAGPPSPSARAPASGGAFAPAPLGPLDLPSPAAPANPVRQPDGTFLFVASSARILPGVVYRFTISTHCGVTPASFDFDGSYWDPVAEITPPSPIRRMPGRSS